MVGDDIEVTVERVKGNQVWLGFKAPRELPIHRREVYDAIQRERGGEEVQP